MRTPSANTHGASQKSIRRSLCCLDGEEDVTGYWSSVAETFEYFVSIHVFRNCCGPVTLIFHIGNFNISYR